MTKLRGNNREIMDIGGRMEAVVPGSRQEGKCLPQRLKIYASVAVMS